MVILKWKKQIAQKWTERQLILTKTDFIIAGYNQFHSYLRNDESYEHKISLAIGGFFLAFGALVLRRQFGSISLYQALAMSCFLLIVAGFTFVFLVSNIKEMRTICQRIVSFETVMAFTQRRIFKR